MDGNIVKGEILNVKKHNRSIAGKIIITSLLACVAIFLSLYISKVTFTRILSTVDKLARPNEKIHLVNDIFQNVVRLDHMQRAQAIKKDAPTQYNPFLKESEQLQGMLDSLRAISEQNPRQVARIDSMKKILYQRDLLFLKYIKLRLNLIQNDTLAGQVKDLSEMIEKARAGIDSNRVTITKVTRTTIDTLPPEEEKHSLWKRIFSKRRAPVKQVQKQIEEQLKVRVDTLGLGNKGDSLAKLGKAISQVETNRVSRRAVLLGKQEELNYTGDVLITQLISILNDIEHDEMAHDNKQNMMANQAVNEGIQNISAVLIVFMTGIAVLIFLIFTDIARSNRYRRELVAAKEEAEEAGRVKQRFLANMSHELRTPLQTIIGTSEQVKNKTTPSLQELENIHQSSLHLLQIVNEVLDYSRIISGKYTIEQKPFNMLQLLDEVNEMIAVQLDAKNLSFHYTKSVIGNSYYSGDAFRLKQVLLNLLGNAIKFTSKGSVSLTVTEQELKNKTSLFTFVVQDTGIGISEEDLGVIFNEFEQGHESYKKPGTGLGLSIVKAMIDIQQGSIDVKSEIGKGTTFTITLPYAKTNITEEQITIAQDITAFAGHVWVVDDDAYILQLCDSILTKHNIPHTCFSSPLDAEIASFPGDLKIIFLDVRMGEMSGITLCRKLRERNNGPISKYVAITAQAFPDEQVAILNNGFDGLVIKPFLEQDLVNAIAAYGLDSPPTDGLAPDLSVIRKMTGENEQMLSLVLQSFIAETERDTAAARQFILDKDPHGLAEALHKLAGRCGQTGVYNLSHKLRIMEIALHNGEPLENVLTDADMAFKEIELLVTKTKQQLDSRDVPTSR